MFAGCDGSVTGALMSRLMRIASRGRLIPRYGNLVADRCALWRMECMADAFAPRTISA